MILHPRYVVPILLLLLQHFSHGADYALQTSGTHTVPSGGYQMSDMVSIAANDVLDISGTEGATPLHELKASGTGITWPPNYIATATTCWRHFKVLKAATLKLRHLKLTGGVSGIDTQHWVYYLGGSIFVNGRLEATSVWFYGNKANRGGAIFVRTDESSPAIAVVQSCTFEGNTARIAGGAIMAQGSTATFEIKQTLFKGNRELFKSSGEYGDSVTVNSGGIVNFLEGLNKFEDTGGTDRTLMYNYGDAGAAIVFNTCRPSTYQTTATQTQTGQLKWGNFEGCPKTCPTGKTTRLFKYVSSFSLL